MSAFPQTEVGGIWSYQYLCVPCFTYQALNLNNSLRNHMGLEGKFLPQNGRQYVTQPSPQHFSQHCKVVF